MFLQITKQHKFNLTGSVLICSAMFLTACGGGSDSTTSSGNTSENTQDSTVSSSIPSSDNSKVYRFQKRSTAGTGTVNLGDTVKVSYKMFNHGTGELVESSDEIDYVIGHDGSHDGVTVPKALITAMEEGLIGETYWVYFPENMEDLPKQFDKNNAYTVKFKILSREENS